MKTLINYINDYINEDYIDEGKAVVTAKDWQRAIDLCKNGDSAIQNQADRIKDAHKAAQRYVAGVKLLDINPEESWGPGTNSWNKDKYYFHDTFGDMGDRAIELGMTYDEIIELYNSTPDAPEDLYAAAHRIQFGVNDSTFVGSISRALKKYGITLIKSKITGRAKTSAGIESMERNGRKWTEWANVTLEKDGKTVETGFDCITDEGGGTTIYATDDDWRAISAKELAGIISDKYFK